jgi:hypothetical protein
MQPGLVGLDLKKVGTLFFDDGTGVGEMAVQRIGRDDFAIQRGDDPRLADTRLTFGSLRRTLNREAGFCCLCQLLRPSEMNLNCPTTSKT